MELTEPGSCRSCAAPLAGGSSFCPDCGVAVAKRPSKGYRGPVVVGGSGLAICAVGTVVALATFGSISADGGSGVLMDIAGPWVNDVLSATGSSEIEQLDDGGGASWGLLAAFLVSVLVATVGALVALGGGAWALARWGTPDRRRELRAQAAPVAQQGRERSKQLSAAARPVAQDGLHKGRELSAAGVRELKRRRAERR